MAMLGQDCDSDIICSGLLQPIIGKTATAWALFIFMVIGIFLELWFIYYINGHIGKPRSKK